MFLIFKNTKAVRENCSQFCTYGLTNSMTSNYHKPLGVLKWWLPRITPGVLFLFFLSLILAIGISTEALKGHRVVWKIEIYYLIRMT